MAKVVKRILKTVVILITGYVSVVAILSAIGPVLRPNYEEDDDFDSCDLFDEEYDDIGQEEDEEDEEDEDRERILNSV